MDKKDNTIIAFSQKAGSALLDIEKRYNLEENDKEWMEKLKKNIPFNRKIVSDLIREFAKDNLSEKGFIDSLQKNLNLEEKGAKNLFEDIVKNVVPFLDKISEENMEKKVIPKNKPHVSDNNTPIAPLEPKKAASFQKGVSQLKTEKTNIPKKKKIIKKAEERPTSKKIADKYREQI